MPAGVGHGAFIAAVEDQVIIVPVKAPAAASSVIRAMVASGTQSLTQTWDNPCQYNVPTNYVRSKHLFCCFLMSGLFFG